MKQMLGQSVTALFKLLKGLPASIGLSGEREQSRQQSHDPAVHPSQQRVMEYESIESGRRAQSVVYQTLWLQELIRRMRTHQDVTDTQFLAPVTEAVDEEELDDETWRLMSLLQATLKSFGLEFNALTAEVAGFEGMRVSTTDLRDVKEQPAAKQYGIAEAGAADTRHQIFVRFRTSTPAWSLSVRGERGRIEFFLVPAAELFLLSQAETPVRLKSVLRMNERIGEAIWTIDGLPADPDELFYLCRLIFKNLLFASAQGQQEHLDSAAMLQNLEGEALRDTVRELLLAGQNMAQKIVSQQEEIQTRIARDLHDSVIADIMALKRSIEEHKGLDGEEISKTLEQISQRLRDICHDLTPRDLRDWGLQTVVEDMLERLAQRTGADCLMECERELPEFPYPVQLHLYRIIQESLNNVEKYAQATRVTVRFEVSEQLVRLIMHDNGKGFSASEQEARRAREGGTGMSGIRERADMIRCFYPTQLKVESQPGQGSSTTLEMRLSPSGWGSTN